MRPQKFNHMKGGKVFGIIIAILTVGLIILIFLLFSERRVDFISALSLLVAIGSVIWLTYKLYKPAFTEVVFSDDGIVSKTHCEQEKLSIKDIKGIWYYKNMQGEEKDIKPYAEEDNLKGSIVVIGDIDSFQEVQHVGLNGSTMLRDSFKKGYTTLYYRKELRDVLKDFNRKIRQRPASE